GRCNSISRCKTIPTAMDNFDTAESMHRLDQRLQISERALLEARRRRGDLEYFLSEMVRQATDAEQRTEQAREQLASLEHRQEVQRRELQHWERLAAEAQQTATEATEELSKLLNVGRATRNRLNDSACGFVDRLFASLPWSPPSSESTVPPPSLSEDLAKAAAESDAQMELAADKINRIASQLPSVVAGQQPQLENEM
ncbi:hypothetical protein BOX15_Mlig024183g3, partial [Macrostomum lignano]